MSEKTQKIFNKLKDLLASRQASLNKQYIDNLTKINSFFDDHDNIETFPVSNNEIHRPRKRFFVAPSDTEDEEENEEEEEAEEERGDDDLDTDWVSRQLAQSAQSEQIAQSKQIEQNQSRQANILVCIKMFSLVVVIVCTELFTLYCIGQWFGSSLR